jgi:small subunit ribosomal protein S14
MGIMKAPSVRDKLKRSVIWKNEEKKKYLKALMLNKKFKFTGWSKLTLNTLPHYKVRNRCIITGRGKAINQTFKLSRLEFRRWANLSKLPGLKKSSW